MLQYFRKFLNCFLLKFFLRKSPLNAIEDKAPDIVVQGKDNADYIRDIRSREDENAGFGSVNAKI